MVKEAFGAILVSFVSLSLARPAFAVDQVKPPAFHEELGQAWDVIGHEMQGLFQLWQEHFGSTATREEGPPVSLIIRNREKLGLSSEQVKNLERLRNDFEKESIRKEADIRVAKMDLRDLLEAQPVDMSKVEAKVREIERLRADLRFARIRTVAKGKEQLTADQRKKLEELLAESQLTRLQP
jgi:Spy/CpxP family protein refolding chaperone